MTISFALPAKFQFLSLLISSPTPSSLQSEQFSLLVELLVADRDSDLDARLSLDASNVNAGLTLGFWPRQPAILWRNFQSFLPLPILLLLCSTSLYFCPNFVHFQRH